MPHDATDGRPNIVKNVKTSFAPSFGTRLRGSASHEMVSMGAVARGGLALRPDGKLGIWIPVVVMQRAPNELSM